jgi:hypothetical protein
MTDRDTHFQGFAKLLWQDLLNANRGLLEDRTGIDAGNDPSLYPEFERVISQRAYDLSCHDVEKLNGYDLEYETGHHSYAEIVSWIPDLTQWPESPTPLPDAPTEQAPSSD